MHSSALIGFLGTLMVLIAFVMNQKHKWEEDFLEYDLSNLIGSALLVLYAYIIKAYPFMLLDFVWFVVSFIDVVKYFRNLKSGKKVEGSTHNLIK
jgi:hypothetical protein